MTGGRAPGAGAAWSADQSAEETRHPGGPAGEAGPAGGAAGHDAGTVGEAYGFAEASPGLGLSAGGTVSGREDAGLDDAVAGGEALDAGGGEHDRLVAGPGELPDFGETGEFGELPDFGEIGDEDEFVADETPLSDPVTDEAEPEAAEPGPASTPHAGDPNAAEPAGRTRDDLVDYGEPEPEAVGEDDDVDEFAAFEADEPDDEVPPPPSGRVRSSPLPPLDWGPGLGGLTGRRRTNPRRHDPENHTP